MIIIIIIILKKTFFVVTLMSMKFEKISVFLGAITANIIMVFIATGLGCLFNEYKIYSIFIFLLLLKKKIFLKNIKTNK